MEKINEKNILKQYPLMYDMNLIVEKELGTEERGNERFMHIVNNYKALLGKYLLKKTSLKKLDDKLLNSPLDYKPLKEIDMDYYQITSTMGLKFLYLRNNLNIEKLSKEDLELLDSLSYDSLELTDELYELIDKTYKAVINPTAVPQDQPTKTILCYGPDLERFSADVRDIVFGVRFDQFYEGSEDDDKFVENDFKRCNYLQKFMEELNETITKELGLTTRSIEYNEFTVHDNYSYYK